MTLADSFEKPDCTLDHMAELADWAWEADTHLNITAISEGIYQQLGWQDTDVLGHQLLNLPRASLLPASGPEVLQERFRHLKRVRVMFLEANHRDGHSLLYSINAAPRFDELGKYVGYRGIATRMPPQAAAGVILESFEQELADKLGMEYFHQLVKALANILEMDHVFVGRLFGESLDKVETLSFWSDGDWRDNFLYELEHTPCSKAVYSEMCMYTEGVAEHFPKDEHLIRLQVESYLASPLHSRTGDVVGLLVCMSRQPLPKTAHLLDAFALIAERAAAELERLGVEEKLRQERRTLEQAQKITGFGAWRYDIHNDELMLSEVARQLLPLTAKQIAQPQDVLQYLPQEYQTPLQQFWESLMQGGDSTTITFPLQLEHSAIRWFQVIASAETDVLTGELTRVSGVVKDISDERASQQQLRLLTEAVAQSSNAISITDLDGTIIYVNPTFTEMTGFSTAEAIGQQTSILKSGLTPLATYQQLWGNVTSGRAWHGELNNRRKNGDLYWANTLISPLRDTDGRVCNYLSVQEDISVRKQQEERLLHQAHHDTLTDLPNRLLAFDRLSLSLKHSRRFNHQLSLLFIDLDNFKQVNDSLGHDAGDQLLVKVARRLQSTLRDGDTVARLGGDEFLVILESANANAAELGAKRIKQVLAAPMSIDSRELVTTASIGITQYPADGETPEVLMRNADAAMYKAKASGKNTFRFYTQAMNDESQRRLEVETELRRALARDEIQLVYQPIVEMDTKRIIGAEALARWTNGRLGVVSPVDFIPLAEELGLIVDIGDWIIQEAAASCQQWLEVTPEFLMAINISPRQLRDSILKRSLKTAMQDHQVDCHHLMLEVTEGVLVDNVDAALAYLSDLSAEGIQLAIDDFGTGYSSLSYLKTFPFNRLKIDRSFVGDVLKDSEGETLVRVMVDLAHKFGMTVVAEGVESESQYRFLRSIGVDSFQGYYFSPPLSAVEFSRLLQSNLASAN
jgi:diguanylate cyclase (GGDEF)-like protein/PAS domain S-box-containing protein